MARRNQAGRETLCVCVCRRPNRQRYYLFSSVRLPYSSARGVYISDRIFIVDVECRRAVAEAIVRGIGSCHATGLSLSLPVARLVCHQARPRFNIGRRYYMRSAHTQ